MTALTRRRFLQTATGAALGAFTGFDALRAAAEKIGTPLEIVDVEPLILRDPPERDKPEDAFVSMTPLGGMTGGVGLWNRLERAETVRQGGYRQTLLVKVTTKQGVVGWGESHAVMTPRVVQTVITDMLSPILLGEDARNVEVLWEKMYSTQRLRGYSVFRIARVSIAARIRPLFSSAYAFQYSAASTRDWPASITSSRYATARRQSPSSMASVARL